jgi:hypothetical protein
VLRSLFILLFPVAVLSGQTNCTVEKIHFSDEEVLQYEVYYDWGLIWVNAAKTSFSIKKEVYGKHTIFHMVGEGSTHKGYDWFFKVRDTFQCWSDTLSLKPFRFTRDSHEGNTRVFNDSYFNYQNKTVTCRKLEKGKVRTDTTKLKPCTFDVLSMVYYARCIDYSKYKIGTKIPISLYLDGEINDTLYLRYLGESKIKTALGEKNCIVFSPLLIKGTIFSGGEDMKVWVTNDEKKIPVLVTTPIIVGNIQVKITSVKGY